MCELIVWAEHSPAASGVHCAERTRRGPTNSRHVMLHVVGTDLVSASCPSCILHSLIQPSEEPDTAILPLLMRAVTGAAARMHDCEQFAHSPVILVCCLRAKQHAGLEFLGYTVWLQCNMAVIGGI